VFFLVLATGEQGPGPIFLGEGGSSPPRPEKKPAPEKPWAKRDWPDVPLPPVKRRQPSTITGTCAVAIAVSGVDGFGTVTKPSVTSVEKLRAQEDEQLAIGSW